MSDALPEVFDVTAWTEDGEIMGLRAGDIIQLNVAGLDEVELWVEGKRKFIGKGAQRNGNKVFVNTRACE